MGKILVLAEKPSVGRDIARVLDCAHRGNGYFEGSQYIVTWALGHLVTLADPEVYNRQYKSWQLDDLPMLPETLNLVVIKQTSKQYQTVREQLYRKDVTEVVIATDAGREGELVARWILEKARVKKPLKRLWISSVTDKAIKEGFGKLKSGQEYENLYHSAVARAEADWLVGINATRALTCKNNAQLSCGRVQSPTLAIIAMRETEIQNFKPRPFYGITALTEKFKLTWQDAATKENRMFDQERCGRILALLQGKNATVTAVEKTRKKTYAPQLYDLTELQRDANKRFSFSAKETLAVMQDLYERHKLLTYPRTDSRYISTDIVDTLPERIKACSPQLYGRFTRRLLLNTIKAEKHFVDNSKVSDHHAIIPTEQPVVLSSLNDKEKKIYDLVVRRFLAVLYPPFEYEQSTVRADICGEQFWARGKVVLAAGWKEVYDNSFEEDEALEDDESSAEQNLPPVNKGDSLSVLSLAQTNGFTKPPQPFTEATLLSAMENPAKFMAEQDKSLIQTITRTSGLGTVATRADIIEKLFNNFLIEKKGKSIFMTSKGKQLLELVPDGLKTPALTARWEQQLEAIARGALSKDKFVDEMKKYTQAVVVEIKNSRKKFRHDNISGSKCPDCGKNMLEVNGKKGKMLICQDRQCGYRKNVSLITNARCPTCRKQLELHGEGEGQIFICKCGFREKLSSFNEKRKNDRRSLDKREVSKFLAEQDKGQSGFKNTAMAEALAKLKLK